jgi:hypothetical protein
MLCSEMAGEMGTNLTRRDALRRGTLLGAGAVWATPAVRSLTMSSNFAAATSPVVIGEEVEATPTTTGETLTTAGETPTSAGAPPTTDDAKVEGIVVTQPPGSDPQGPGIPVVSGDNLPLTGIEARDAALLGTGLLAVGAALVQATKKDRTAVDVPKSD